MVATKFFSCFTSPEGGARSGARLEATLPSIEVQRVNSSKSFLSILQRASKSGRLMIVEWAANWCSLCLQADLEFAHLAANLAMDQPGHFKFVRVNLDKAEDLALQYKLITLPSFSIFQEGLLIEHYTGLESCRLMQSRLESEHARTSTTDITTNAEALTEVPTIVAYTSGDSGDWDNCAASASSDCISNTSEPSLATRCNSLEWNAFAACQYLPRYKRNPVGDRGAHHESFAPAHRRHRSLS